MSTEIYNNFNPKKAEALDERLITVVNKADLPDPKDTSNFLYLGAFAYVSSENKYYKVVNTSAATSPDSTAKWVLFTPELGVAQLNIIDLTNKLDLSKTDISIAEAKVVQINVFASISDEPGAPTRIPVISKIENFPTTHKISFIVQTGRAVSFRHNDYDTAVNDQIVLENGFDLTLVGRDTGNELVTLENQNGKLCQFECVQFLKKDEWLRGLLDLSIVDNLDSFDAEKALSANAGRGLKMMIAAKQDTIMRGFGIDTTTPSNVIQAKAPNWIRTSYTAEMAVSNTTFDSFKTNLISLTTAILNEDYRVVDANQDASGTNFTYQWGIWVLPIKKEPNSFANWIRVGSPPTPKTLVCQIEIGDIMYGDARGSAGATNNQQVLRYRIDSDYKVGDDSFINYNTADSYATELQLTRPGLYEVYLKYNIKCSNNRSYPVSATGTPMHLEDQIDMMKDMEARLMQTSPSNELGSGTEQGDYEHPIGSWSIQKDHCEFNYEAYGARADTPYLRSGSTTPSKKHLVVLKKLISVENPAKDGYICASLALYKGPYYNNWALIHGTIIIKKIN
jgi:hypothetical protein